MGGRDGKKEREREKWAVRSEKRRGQEGRKGGSGKMKWERGRGEKWGKTSINKEKKRGRVGKEGEVGEEEGIGNRGEKVGSKGGVQARLKAREGSGTIKEGRINMGSIKEE